MWEFFNRRVSKNRIFLLINCTDLNIFISVRSAVFMVESYSVHHLMFDMSQKMGTLANIDSLTDGKRIESHTNPAGAGACVLKDHII